MSAAIDYRALYGGLPHRKPLPGMTARTEQPYQQQQQQQTSPARTRTISSSIVPPTSPSQHYLQQPSYTHPVSQEPFQPSARRSLSSATSSTSSTGTSSAALARAPSNQTYNSSIRRSISSRSESPTSYVALMRKQKATVWCDRAQHEDPRLMALQRAAKMRATMEVVGGNNAAARTSVGNSSGGVVGGVRSKIRHHGAVKASAYTAANLSGAGVPMRLSASEVDEHDSDEDAGGANARFHQRNASGRSSLGSGQRGTSYIATAAPQGLGLHGRFSNGSTPPSAASDSPMEPDADAEAEASPADPGETPVPDAYAQLGEYFEQRGGQGNSGGSSEEERFGDISGLPQRAEPVTSHLKPSSDELRRRGSVDDRTMTMSGVRLFVANPDLSD